MKEVTSANRLIMAVFPSSRGFGFVVIEKGKGLIDWGLKDVQGNKHQGSLAKVRELLERYRPDVVVLEDYAGEGSRRATRIKRLIHAIAEDAQSRGISTRAYSRGAIRSAFNQFDALTKHEIATVVGDRFPELAIRLPPKRKIWMSEDRRMSLFDAASLALTFLFTEWKE